MGVKAGDTVVVGGVGFIAMGHVIAALYRNAKAIALARNPHHIDLPEKMGVEHIDPDDLIGVTTMALTIEVGRRLPSTVRA